MKQSIIRLYAAPCLTLALIAWGTKPYATLRSFIGADLPKLSMEKINPESPATPSQPCETPASITIRLAPAGTISSRIVRGALRKSSLHIMDTTLTSFSPRQSLVSRARLTSDPEAIMTVLGSPTESETIYAPEFKVLFPVRIVLLVYLERLTAQDQGGRAVIHRHRHFPRDACLFGVPRPQYREPGIALNDASLFHGLMRGAILAQKDRVMGEDINHGKLHHGGKPDRGSHVVTEDEVGRTKHLEKTADGDSVGDRGHGVLSYPEVEAPALGIVRREDIHPFHVSRGRMQQVRRPANDVMESRCQGFEYLPACHARGYLVSLLERGQSQISRIERPAGVSATPRTFQDFPASTTGMSPATACTSLPTRLLSGEIRDGLRRARRTRNPPAPPWPSCLP